ncbi:hypothetical protein [Streptomyces violascens]|uniref:hypothetical protein n=1 Tax=Streptomyces violascens TaxID=67381 RepID=UPI0027E56B8E|nr:hypothetical protein [Streptomyces violascens]
MPTTKQLLTSIQVARFVAQGFLRLDAVVPQELNDEAIATLSSGIPEIPYGTALFKVCPVTTATGRSSTTSSPSSSATSRPTT